MRLHIEDPLLKLVSLLVHLGVEDFTFSWSRRHYPIFVLGQMEIQEMMPEQYVEIRFDTK